MDARLLCFTCLYWAQKVEERDMPGVVRSQGRHYILGEEGVPEVERGCDGRRALITYPDGRQVESRNVWCQGPVPAHFRARLPDNARLEWLEEGQAINA